MRPASLAGDHQKLTLASAAFCRRIELSRWPSGGRPAPLGIFIVAKHAVDTELALIDGVVRTLERGPAYRPPSTSAS